MHLSRPAVRCLARLDARAVQLGRQDAAGAHHRGRRRVPAHDVDPRGQGGAGSSQEQDRRGEPLSRRARAATRLLEGTVVAIAAKNARMCWAMLARGEQFELPA
ncbi:unnamed protein product [Phaeothamnion confervicola]